MKILQVYKDVFPEVSGGMERYIHDISLFLMSRGHSVHILVAGGGDRVIEGMEITGVWSPLRIMSNPIAPGYTRILAETDADVIHFHLPLPASVVGWEFVRKSRRKPYIVTYHSDIVRQAFMMPVYGPILRRFLRGAVKVLATSENYLRTSLYLRELQNTEVIPIGANLELFKPACGVKKNYYLFVGRFRKYKGIFVLLEAWRKMSDPPNLILAGGGGLIHKVKKFIRVHKLPVTVLTNVTDDELIKLYQEARALILPSTQRSEAFGMVMVEAMACGTAVISSNLSTGVSWVNRHNETGLLFPAGDVASLGKAVMRLEESAERREEMCLNAEKRVRDVFDSTTLFKKVEECLLQATGI
ncbi:MAG: glycosyltransferase [Candidatus Sabulitectum sp.]|nr:glycosyltransferase [Candidatus Sabulitectum sp.]